MPKRMLLIALALVSLASVAACGNSYNPNNLYGTPAPPATATPQPTPNASITSAIVTVTYGGQSLPNQAVSLYADSAGQISGSAIATQTTGTGGTTTFTGLTGAQNYCFSTSYTPTTTGALAQTQTYCGNLWGFGVTFAF